MARPILVRSSRADTRISTTPPNARITTDVDGKRRKLYESLITTAHDLCALTRDYNVTNDPRLSATVERLESKLEGVTIETLKEDGIKREEVRQEVTALLNAFDSDF